MSSINKSGTRFVPKLTQRNRKTAVSKPSTAPLSRSITPLPSQVLDEENEDELNTPASVVDDNSSSNNKGLLNTNFQLTPPLTQLDSTSAKLLAASSSSAVIDESDDEEDPATKAVDSGNNKASNNNDNFLPPSRRDSLVSTASSYKRPSISLRRDSVASISSNSKPIFKASFGSASNDGSSTTAPHRRLSSLSTGLRPNFSRNRQGSVVISTLPPIFNKPSRSSSISSQHQPSLTTEETAEQIAPVRIDIPLTNEKKRRRPAAQRTSFSSNKKLSTMKRRLSEESPIVEDDDEKAEAEADAASTTPQPSEVIASDKPELAQAGEATSDKDSDKENEINVPKKSKADTGLFVLQDDEFDDETKRPRTRSRRVPQKLLVNDDQREDSEPSKEVFINLDKKKKTAAERARISERRTLELTADEIKAGHKFFLNPITRRLKKITLEEFKKIDYLDDDTVKINNLNSLRGVALSQDADLLNKFEINEDTITLEELCRPSIPIGQVSEDYNKVLQAAKERKRQLLERRRLRLEAREKRISLEELEKQEELRKKIEREELRRKLMKKDEDAATENEEDKAANKPLQLQTNRRRNAPQLTFSGSSGGIQINPDSTTVDRHSMNSNNEFDDRERTEENPYENQINSSSYGKKRYTDKWTNEETKEFYQALSSWGTDFGLISQLFPYRSRRQVKSKFNLEEKRNPHLVELALLRKLPVNIDEYCNRTGKNFKTLDEYNEELRLLKVRHDKEVREMKANREKARLEDLNNQNNAANFGAGRNGVSKYKNRKMQITEFRKNEEVVGTIDEVRRGNEGSSASVQES